MCEMIGSPTEEEVGGYVRDDRLPYRAWIRSRVCVRWLVALQSKKLEGMWEMLSYPTEPEVGRVYEMMGNPIEPELG